MRLLLAGLVIYSHAFELGGFGGDPLARLTNGGWSFGGLAVDGFFFLSGLLITSSYLHVKSVWRYLWHRFLRIFPAFWVCLGVTAFAFAPLAYFREHCTLGGFWRPPTADSPIFYTWNNAFLDIHQWTIDNLLTSLPAEKVAFNGSLWTLATEFRCYLLVAALGSAAVLTRGRWLLVVLLGLFYIAASSFHLASATVGILPPMLRHMLATPEYLQMVEFFLVGCAFCLFGNRIPINAVAFCMAVILIPIACLSPYYNLVEPLALSYALYWLAFRLPIRNFDRFGDFSYGTYIYAYPVQQTLSLFGIPLALGFWPYLALSVAGTAPLAIGSWFAIERSALRLKNAAFKLSFPWVRLPSSPSLPIRISEPLLAEGNRAIAFNVASTNDDDRQ